MYVLRTSGLLSYQNLTPYMNTQGAEELNLTFASSDLFAFIYVTQLCEFRSVCAVYCVTALFDLVVFDFQSQRQVVTLTTVSVRDGLSPPLTNLTGQFEVVQLLLLVQDLQLIIPVQVSNLILYSAADNISRNLRIYQFCTVASQPRSQGLLRFQDDEQRFQDKI